MARRRSVRPTPARAVAVARSAGPTWRLPAFLAVAAVLGVASPWGAIALLGVAVLGMSLRLL